jgi:anti-sigma regulatory factor (Ser/Thr protein kinase)
MLAIHAAVNEALMNAIQIGNQSNPGRPVHVLFSIKASDFSIRIRDEGATILPDSKVIADDGG